MLFDVHFGQLFNINICLTIYDLVLGFKWKKKSGDTPSAPLRVLKFINYA